MKKRIFTILIILSIVFSFENKIFAQGKFQVDYYSNFSAMDMDIFAGVKKATVGYAMAGTVTGISLPLIQSVLIATDTMGTVTWAKKIKDGAFLSFNNLFVNDLQTTAAGGYIMTGSFNDTYAMLLKVDGTGNSVFSYKYGKTPNEFGNAVKELSAGAGYIVAGTTLGKSMNTDKDSTSIYVFKTNATGAYQWGRSYSLTSGPVFDSQDAVNDMVEVPTGYIFAGYHSQKNGVDTTTNILVFKTDASGTLQWMKSYGDLGYNEGATSIKLLSNGNLLVGGYTDRVGIASSVAVLELNAANGNLVSSSAYGVGGLADQLGSIQQTSSGFAIVGWTIGLNYKSFLLTLNSSYTPVTAKTYNSFIGGLFTKGEQVPGGYVIGSMIGNTSYQLHMIKTDANGSSGTGCTESTVVPVQYSYTPAVTDFYAMANAHTFTGGSGSTYTVSLTSITPTTTVECVTLPLVVNAGNDQTSCSGNNVTIGGSPTANFGTSPYTYSWSSSPAGFTSTLSNPVVSPTVTTTYTVTVNDNAGATATDAVIVNVNPLPTAFNVTGSGNYCAGGTGVAIGLSGSQSGVNYQLQVGGVNTGTPVAGTGSAISFGNQTTAGTYTVIATNTTTTCVNNMTGNAVITINPLPTAFNVTGGGDYCIGGSGVVVGLSGSQAGVNYQLQIGGVNTGSAIAGTGSAISFGNQTAAGTYTVVATNSTTTCVSAMTGNVTVTIDPLPTAYNVTGGGSYCAGSTGVVVGLSNSQVGVNYQLLVNGSNTGLPYSGTGGVITFGNQTTAGTYTVTAVNTTTTCSNTMTGNVVITINALPNPNLGADVGTCVGHSVTLSASGGGTYAWSPGTGLSATNIANPVATPGDTTTYTVTVTDINGCSNTDAITVFIYNAPPANAGLDQSVCLGSSVSLAATGGTIYAWSPGTGLSATNISNPLASPAINTTYTVTVTDAAGCSATDNVSITVNPLPVANAGNNQTICPGGSTTLNGTGGITFLWSPAATLSDANIFNPIAQPVTTTTYNLTVTDVNGCSNTDNVIITVNIPTADAGNNTSICTGSSTTLGASGGTSYAWNPSTSLSNANIANPVASPIITTTYTVLVTNANGCTATDNVTVTVNPAPNADAGNPVSICNGLSTPLNASGGSSYLWSPTSGLSNPNIANPVANPTSTTTYTVTVTNGNGCTDTDNITVTILASPLANAGADASVCLGETATLVATGGGAYEWNTGDTTATVIYTPSITTTYVVTVSYTNGCSSTDNVTVTVNSIPSVSLSAVPDPFAYTGQVVTFTAFPAGYNNYIFYVNNVLVQSGSSNIYQSNTLENGQVVTVITNETGCNSEPDSMVMDIKPIPNAFTPYDLDGKNDIFVKGLNLKIINRWGEKLYEGVDGWDGKCNGKLVSPGTYYYVIKVTDLKNVITELTGSVTVVSSK